MGNMSAALAALNLSIAARAYWVGLKALDLGVDAADAPLSGRKAAIARQEMKLALAAIERLVVATGLAWQPIPVDRLLRTQVGLLRDALHYASPEVLQGFGALKPATVDFLSAWRQSVIMVIEALARAVEGKAVEMETIALWSPAIGDLDTDALTRYQRPALNGFANVFAADLLLVEAQGRAALPPGHPTIASPYDGGEMARMLAVARVLEARLDMLTSAFALKVSRGVTAAIVVQRSLRHAQDCLNQLSDEASIVGDARAPAFADLSVSAGQNYILALNLA